MKKTTKLSAFTLAELLVVLVISSIVIATAFLVLNMIRKQVILVQRNYQQKQEVRLFEITLTRDFNNFNAIFDSTNEKIVLLNTKDTITYSFLNNVIVRGKDTFEIELAEKKLFLDGIEVNNSSTIDAIEMNLSDTFANKQLFISNIKDASYYVNSN